MSEMIRLNKDHWLGDWPPASTNDGEFRRWWRLLRHGRHPIGAAPVEFVAARVLPSSGDPAVRTVEVFALDGSGKVALTWDVPAATPRLLETAQKFADYGIASLLIPIGSRWRDPHSNIPHVVTGYCYKRTAEGWAGAWTIGVEYVVEGGFQLPVPFCRTWEEFPERFERLP